MHNQLQGEGMENRWSDRRDLHLGVDVYVGGDKHITCQSRDVGLGGAFLNTGQSHNFGVDTSVELVFHLVEGKQKKKYVLPARIIRVTDSGIGLKFHDFDTGVFRALQQLMCYRGIEAIH